MTAPTTFDHWQSDDGPAALGIREYLIPVEGADGVLFPASFAAEDGAERDKSKFQGDTTSTPAQTARVSASSIVLAPRPIGSSRYLARRSTRLWCRKW